MKTKQGCLYVVATPIGNLNDITLRAIEILKTVDYIFAEDTRHSRILLKHLNIEKPLLTLHDHNERIQTETVIEKLNQGFQVALISDAGTPLISDPGYHLVHKLRILGFSIIPIPGPTAFIAALSVSGLPTDRFCFQGFLSSKATARKEQLESLRHERRTIIFYETPHRVLPALEAMIDIFGGEREACFARELTKSFETILTSNLRTISQKVASDPNQQKGEIVLIVGGYSINTRTADTKLKDNNHEEASIENKAKEPIDSMESMEEPRRILKILLEELPMAKASSIAAKIVGKPKKILYDLALKIM